MSTGRPCRAQSQLCAGGSPIPGGDRDGPPLSLLLGEGRVSRPAPRGICRERVPGELYALSHGQLREGLLPNEPDELELTIIELEDGSGALSMRLRESAIDRPGVVDITRHGGWLNYLKTLTTKAGPG
ncbi:allophanate hydrolase-related protein [Halomonas sp. BC04]|uniref:allophanate hydrolase-related protein n=1 Tax=Halomonas sp. BC04 TaxID=1403540 RepID=UPI001E5944DF|nr:hypothetical protein [Halomonas sp. BC04]